MATGGPVVRKKERLLQLIECPVCLNEQHDPRLLLCRHALCYMCVKDYTEKNKYDKELPCPVCREVTTLYEGGVDNLPKFFFMNELKEVVMEEDGVREGEPKAQGGAVCSTEDCGQPAIKYCKDGCQFICQQCYDEHQSMRITRKHQVITASEGEAFTKSEVPPYPPCHRHNHQLMDLYCRTCNMPVCVTCSQGDHRGHDCCDLGKHAEMCKTKLEQIFKETDGLIDVVKHAMDKTKSQVKQAETDIDYACNNVKTTFKIMHDKLDEQEAKMLSELHEAKRRMKKTTDVITDSQMMTLGNLESLKSCQVKLIDKDRAYDYVTVTGSIQRDVDYQCRQQVPGFMWSSNFSKKIKSGLLDDLGNVVFTQTDEDSLSSVKGEVKEVGRIRLHNHRTHVMGLVVYKEHIYVAHTSNLIIYCFTLNGTLHSKYKHAAQRKIPVEGMCLMDGESPMLVVSDYYNNVLVWIRINNDFTMDHRLTQQVQYTPHGSYNDQGNLMVCDPASYKIHCYTGGGEPLSVITLTDAVKPHWITRHSDGEQYVVTAWENHQVAVIDDEGHVNTRYKNEIHGVKLDTPYDITTDKQGRLLIVDNTHNQVLMLASDEDQAEYLLHDQQIMSPFCLFLDDQHDKLYVSGQDKDEKECVFVYDYSVMTDNRTCKETLTKIHLNVEI